MYHEGDPRSGAADSPSQPATGMEASEAVGYLQARFMRARLNGKLQTLTRYVQNILCSNVVIVVG